MKRSLEVFFEILKDTKSASALYDFFESAVRPPIDYSDLLRWQWAQSVSALDKFVHDIVKAGMLEIFKNDRQPTSKYLDFGLSMDTYHKMTQDSMASLQQFEQQIAHKHSHLSFQEPEKICDALSYVWDEKHKWRCISDHMGEKEETTRIQLKNISIRRNQIVHEGDYSDMRLSRQAIVKDDAVEVIRFVEKIGNAIYSLVKL